VEKFNLLIENIPYHSFNGDVIYDEMIENITRGMITYITDGNDDKLFNKCDINEYKKNPNKKYYFVFSSHMLRWDTFEKILVTEDLIGNIFRGFLSSSNVTCSFIDIHESDELFRLKKISRILNRFNFDKSKIWILNNDCKIEEYVRDNRLGLQVKKTNYLSSFTHDVFYDDYDSIKKYVDSKFFLCINKRPKIHRISTLAYLKNLNLLDQTNYSILENNNEEDSNFNLFLGEKESLRLKNDLEYVLLQKPKQTDYEGIHNTDLLNIEKYTYAGIIDLDDYRTTTVNIVAESMYESDSVHITEKSFKPFGFCLLPIFVATPHHVKFLREYYNLDVFDDIIDHSYDNETNHRLRIKLVIKEAERLYSNKKQIIDFFNNNKTRILKNREILKKIYDSKLDYNFFKENILCK
jgi:hypothetical protein